MLDHLPVVPGKGPFAALALLLATVAAPSLQGAVLANYSFTSGSAVSTDSEPYTNATPSAFGAFSTYPGPSGAPAFASGRAQVSGLATGTDVTTAATLNAALTNGAYLGFTLQPAGASISLESLTFDHGFLALNTNQAASVAVLANTTGTFSAGDVVATYSFSNTGASADFGPIGRNISLAENAGLQDVTTDIYIRLYFYDNVNQSGRLATIDNVVVNGAVVIPEPVSVALLSMSMGGLCLLRRRSC